MLIDCDSCAVRGAACSDCVVSVLLDLPATGDQPEWAGAVNGAGGAGPADAVELAPDEQRALGVLASRGFIPPLRLQPPRAV